VDSAEFENRLRSGNPPSLLYLFGAEDYLLNRALNQLITTIVPPDARDFNLQQFEGGEVSGQTLLEAVQTLPIFAPRRLVLVRRADKLPAAESETILDYLSNPVPESVLVFSGGKLDRRSRLAKAWQKNGELVEFKKLYDNQIPAFVRSMLRDSGRKLTNDALTLLCRRVGTNLQEIAGELEKLFAYAGEQDPIECEAVKAVVCNLQEETIFALGDALGKRSAGEAIRLMENLIQNGEPPVLIISLLARHFRQLWRTHDLLSAKLSKPKLATELKIRPFFVDNLVSQARRFRSGQFPEIMRLLLAADLALKSGGGMASGLLLNLVLDVTRCAADDGKR